MRLQDFVDGWQGEIRVGGRRVSEAMAGEGRRECVDWQRGWVRGKAGILDGDSCWTMGEVGVEAAANREAREGRR